METAVTSISLLWSTNEVMLDTGPLNKAFAELRKCTADLVKSWGLDPAEQVTLSRRPELKGSLSDWVRPGDLPSDVLLSGRQSGVNFRLIVGPDGKLIKCEIQRGQGNGEFERVCNALMHRAAFEPALNAEGKPVASYFLLYLGPRIDRR
jgi:hypothetical protein